MENGPSCFKNKPSPFPLQPLTSRRTHPMIDVLLIKPSSLGDIIHCAPAAELIARSRADCRLTWLANEEYASFVRELPGVADVIAFPRQRFRGRRFPFWIAEAALWCRGLRRGFDVAVDLQGLQRSGLMARLSGARERFGPADARELAALHYNRAIDLPAGLEHATDRLLHLAMEVLKRSALLGAPPSGAPLRAAPLAPPAWARREADELLGRGKRAILALCPGARWRSKLWPEERWAELLGLLAARRPDLRPVFLGGREEQGFAAAVIARAGAPGENLAGKASLWVTAAILARSLAAVTLDSAPLHLAAAAGTPTLALFGPTEPRRVAPRGPAHAILRRDLDCLGCYARRCPLVRHACLPDIRAEEVFETLAGMLAQGR
jgi:ADP-heptose:LPS heptosyltransferase